MTGKAGARNGKHFCPPVVAAVCEPVALLSATRTGATGDTTDPERMTGKPEVMDTAAAHLTGLTSFESDGNA